MKLNKNQIKPILDAIARVRPELVRFGSANGKIFACGYNGGVSFIVYSDSIDEIDAITINANLFLSIISKLPNDEFELNVKNTVCEIKCEKVKFKISLASNDSVPTISFEDGVGHTELLGSILFTLIKKTVFATAQKQNKLTLTGVNLCAKNGTLVATGLDGTRMSRVYENIDLGQEFNVTIPNKEILSVISLFNENEDIRIYSNSRQLFISQGNVNIVLSILNGEYPNVDRLVPNNSEYQLIFNKIDLIKALDTVSLLTNDKRTVKLVTSDNKCTIESTTNELGSAETNVECRNCNQHFEIYFNANYLLEALNSIDSSEITLEFNGSLKPFFIKTNNDKQLELFTPIRA